MRTAPATDQTVIMLPSVADLRELSDAELIELHRSAGAARQQVDAHLASIAGELGRRSDRTLGHDGLVARTGAASVEKALQKLVGVSFSEAKALATVGAALESPWLAPLHTAIAAGDISIASAAAITTGLGAPSSRVASDDLLDAATDLIAFARQSTPEHTATAARHLRDELDTEAVTDLEAHRRSRRSLKWFTRADALVEIRAVCDPESAAEIIGPIESILSPRRGGPRFVGAGEAEHAKALTDDPRTNEQLALDALVDIIRLATRAAGAPVDEQKLFGDRSPAVRVHVQAESLAGGARAGRGVAYLEGQTPSISVQTAERHICISGILPIVFDGLKPIDVGRRQRLHSPRQRAAIAAQWNGCPWGDCDKPASMTEVHHIEAFNGTNTTLANGISLCRFHHMELHANGWRIRVQGHPDGGGADTHWLIPPPELEAAQTPIPLRSRSPFVARRR